MRTTAVFTLLAAVLLVSAAAAVFVGAVAIGPGDVLAALLGSDDTNGTIIRDLRLPRVLGAALVGAALAGAGVLLQGLLRNPLADPFVTGTQAGASLGAVTAVVLGADAVLMPLASFLGAMLAIGIVWRLARLGGRTTVLTVLLAGVVLTSFAGAVMTLILVSSDRLSLRLRAILGWLQGGVSVVSWGELAVAAVVVGIGVVLAVLLAPRIDAYAFGEGPRPRSASTRPHDGRVLVTTALLTEPRSRSRPRRIRGLVVPHALRFLLGATHRRPVASLPAGGRRSCLPTSGPARCSPGELPAGVITGLVGAPFFLALLVRSRRVCCDATWLEASVTELVARGIRAGYGDRDVVRGVDLAAHGGESSPRRTERGGKSTCRVLGGSFGRAGRHHWWPRCRRDGPGPAARHIAVVPQIFETLFPQRARDFALAYVAPRAAGLPAAMTRPRSPSARGAGSM